MYLFTAKTLHDSELEYCVCLRPNNSDHQRELCVCWKMVVDTHWGDGERPALPQIARCYYHTPALDPQTQVPGRRRRAERCEDQT